MRIVGIEEEKTDRGYRLSAVFEFDRSGLSPVRLWFEVPASARKDIRLGHDPFAVLALPIAGRVGEPIRGDGKISNVLLHNLNEAAGVYASYFPKRFRPPPIELEVEVRSRGLGETASFFSGGVDSLYNVAEMDRRAERRQGVPVDRLWLVHGFDILLQQEVLWEQSRSRLEEAYGNLLPQRLEKIRTNIREVYDPFVSWPQLGFSAALGGLAKFFAPTVSRVLVASYAGYADVIPHASSPLVDPLWSCDEQDIVHFSCLATRLEKLRVIGERPELLSGLRVCWKNDGDRYNCGTCEKCVRTRAQLNVLGLDEHCHPFEGSFDPSTVAGVKLSWKRSESYLWGFWKEIADEARARGTAPKTRKAIEGMLRRNRPRLLRRLISRS